MLDSTVRQGLPQCLHAFFSDLRALDVQSLETGETREVSQASVSYPSPGEIKISEIRHLAEMLEANVGHTRLSKTQLFELLDFRHMF